jgi:type IV pilus assembly protein PilA
MANYYPPPQQQPPQKKSSTSTWVIVLIVVLAFVFVVLPILSVMAIYGVRKYIANAKTAEARVTIGQLARSANSAFERDHKLCASASVPVPAVVPSGVKYMSSPSDWEVDKAANAGFSCLGFSMATPQYFQYDYKATPTSFTITARGDLDGDGTASTFQLGGKIVGGNLVVDPTIAEQNVEE